ncbi:follitropin subunit beta-like [Acanthopagrus latus]|uniref:follitropin subunit beta-like n=1 Tax=Acanthopagrus latus TaxID=8177 RepID=UPI00187CBD31|nr:follitropin subunit beta-like [Acanthopagrus latus]XP_036960641.1 follitropin subunit beta-like [Acanthopagrus latus]XP_036960642.1 follitropin subunit beta-like [Acanthopagrus latus]XP_036960643.1 follitropin subunit beta-like [Acanthopagrus latus]
MPSVLLLKCMLLCAMTGWTACICMLKNHTIWIERQDCGQCVAVNTTICSGFCYTKDTNLRGRLGRIFLVQRSCVPLSLEYQATSVPGCPQDVNPEQYYPVAHQCSCRRCDARTHHCIRASPVSYDRCIATLSGMKSQRQPALTT